MGTRGSALALAQTQRLMAKLQQIHPDLKIELLKITTSGDRIQDRFLSEVGGKGLFVKEIEAALLKDQIDVAVHSLKDVPSVLPQGLALACFPKRKDPQDVLITSAAYTLEALPQGAKVGTVSLRRRVQLQQQRPDLQFGFLRGNLETRLKKLEEGKFDAIVLAQAGLERLGLSLEKAKPLGLIPAPGQGTLGLECREGDKPTLELLSELQDPATTLVSTAERRVAAALEGDCHLPLGVWAQLRGEQFLLKVFLSLPDGTEIISLGKSGEKESWERVTEEMIRQLEQEGAANIVERCRHWGNVS